MHVFMYFLHLMPFNASSLLRYIIMVKVGTLRGLAGG